MGRKKKTTVNHFLNIRLKPKQVENENGTIEERYPIYVKIRSHYKQTQIKSIYWLFQYDQLSQMPELKELHNSELDDSNLYLTVKEFELHIKDETPTYFLMQREKYFIEGVAETLASIFNENFDIKYVTRNLFDLMIPIQQLVYDSFSADLRKVLNENRYNDLVEIINWELPFWKIFLGLHATQEVEHADNALKKILDSNTPYHNLVMSLRGATNDKIIWAFEWNEYLTNNSQFLEIIKSGIDRNEYSTEEYKKFMSMIGLEIGIKLNQVISNDLEF